MSGCKCNIDLFVFVCKCGNWIGHEEEECIYCKKYNFSKKSDNTIVNYVKVCLICQCLKYFDNSNYTRNYLKRN